MALRSRSLQAEDLPIFGGENTSAPATISLPEFQLMQLANHLGPDAKRGQHVSQLSLDWESTDGERRRGSAAQDRLFVRYDWSSLLADLHLTFATSIFLHRDPQPFALPCFSCTARSPSPSLEVTLKVVQPEGKRSARSPPMFDDHQSLANARRTSCFWEARCGQQV